MTTVLRWLADTRITGACPTIELARSTEFVALYQPAGTAWRRAAGPRGGPRGRNLLPDGAIDHDEVEWAGDGVVRTHRVGEPWSVWRWITAAGEWLPQLYVNLEDPWRETDLGFDSGDWILDLVVEADGGWHYKDLDELEWAERTGHVSARWAARTRAAGERAASRLGGAGFGIDWDALTPAGDLPIPRLPTGWDVVVEAGSGA